MSRDFVVVLRGYDRVEVERVVSLAEAALASGNEVSRAAARTAIGEAQFTVRLRGYDRGEVDQELARLRQVLG
ncbi:DivIVA domain-containing protein [Actinoplanes sp. NPDC049596]|uniref:DivIVA domain-containing protein n=1 Tax=unclassified Actinoplanes TaxID=2626549 RepID=UPI003436C7D8